MSYSASPAQHAKMPQSPQPANVEAMRSGNLQYQRPTMVEDMRSGGLQYHMSSNFQGDTPQYAEDIRAGGLQYHEYYPSDHADQEDAPPSIEVEKAPVPMELPIVSAREMDTTPERKILGLSRRIFWLLAAFLALIVIGAVVGGAVAGTQNRPSNTSADAGAGAAPGLSTTSAVVNNPSTVTVVLGSSAGTAAPTGSGTPTTITASSSFAPSLSTSANTPTSTPPSGPGPSAAQSTPVAPPTVTVVSTVPANTPSGSAATLPAIQSTATPQPQPVNPTRYNPQNIDGNYFVNCQNSQGYNQSRMAYYKILQPGKNAGQAPDDSVVVSTGNGFTTWEMAGSVAFKTNTVIHWSIISNAPSMAVNQRVGAADNTYEQFWVYKDANTPLYQDGDFACRSVYFAF